MNEHGIIHACLDDLVYAIFEQAIQDWKRLERMGKDKIVTNYGTISKQEIRDFFYSDWCDTLAENKFNTNIFKVYIKGEMDKNL